MDVLVTGANRGIGRAIAEQLAPEYDVAVASLLATDYSQGEIGNVDGGMQFQ